MSMEAPEVDFATLARSLGVRGEGPVKQIADLQAALPPAVAAVRGGGCVAIDVWRREPCGPALNVAFTLAPLDEGIAVHLHAC